MTFMQIAISFTAILLLGLLAQRLFKAPPVSEKQLTDKIHTYFPDQKVRLIRWDDRRQAAVVYLTEPSMVIFASILGDKVSLKLCKSFDISNITATENHLIIAFNDVTYPKLSFYYKEQDQLQLRSDLISFHQKTGAYNA